MVSRLSSQSTLKDNSAFYTLSITALGDSTCVETAGTRWLGRSDDDINEIRKARPHADTSPWELLKECWVQVENRSDLLKFLISGGHSLITHKVISEWWPEFFAPTECFRYSESVPFLGSEYLPPGAQERHPPPLIRKRVLARDDYRCRVCGYSPQDHPAIKLEIHHVIERGVGGFSVESNLLTLCKNCHDNATPPDAWLRHDLLEKVVVAASRFHRRSHEQGVDDYRVWAARALGAQEAANVLGTPLEYLTADDFDESKRYAKWYQAYMSLSANSLVRYFPTREWRRNLPSELKRR